MRRTESFVNVGHQFQMLDEFFDTFARSKLFFEIEVNFKKF